MIQRIQSLFLALVAILMSAFLFVNIWNKSNISTQEEVSLNAYSLNYTKAGVVILENSVVWLAILAFIIIAFSIFSLFSFKKRMLQLQLGLVNAILIAALLGFIVYYSFKGNDLITNSEKGTFGPGLIIPSVCLILNNLANRFIRKDENLVKSADRIR